MGLLPKNVQNFELDLSDNELGDNDKIMKVLGNGMKFLPK